MPPRRVPRHQSDAESSFGFHSSDRGNATGIRLDEQSRLSASSFKGILEALMAIAWLCEIERYFRALGTLIFKAQYTNEDQRNEVVNRFETLIQGNSTVNEYLIEFTGWQALLLDWTFYTLTEIVVATQRAEVIEESLDFRRSQRRGNDRKATRRNQE
ncbi:hypothetical protein PanWU01x14_133410 [Parasponia andersonii]|uniref:Retrotransposon gag domain-containing protein n=1 Tax=Parasponia andersonii TaxID=3476 RepID=A0A2P5CQB4_PARAD|nr:hypothetical protein PanWU01x14_133410 [Parasponia andersonii]